MSLIWWSVGVVVFLWLLYKDYKFRNWYNDIPGPPTVPFLGNILLYLGFSSGDVFEILNMCWKLYGTRIRIYIGSRALLFLSKPEDVEAVLVNQQFINKSKEYNFLFPWLGTGLLTSKGEKWKKHRKIITPAFHFKILENFVEIFEKQTDILTNIMRQHSDGESFNVYPIIANYTFDVISETAMGVSINAQKDSDSEYVKAVNWMCEVIYDRMKNPVLQIDILFRLSSSYKQQQKALKILHDFTNKVIVERRDLLSKMDETLTTYTNDDVYGKKKKMAFLDVLLLSTIDDKPLSNRDIREEVDTFLFEGYDTTASAISFALFLISQNQEVQEKIFDEQKLIFGSDLNSSASYADLQNMKYLELVIKETLRMYPSVPMFGRDAIRDTTINDINVKAGTSVNILAYQMNRNPDVFYYPDKFIPERFTVEESTKRHPFSTISFSAGSRNCIGQKYAILEIKSILSRTVRMYKLTASDEVLKLRCDLILKSVNGIFIKLNKRIV